MDESEGVVRSAVATSAAAPTRAAWLTFLLQWLKNPRSMSSVAPSGRQLASMMVNAMPADTSHVVELGAGPGAITSALLAHGIAPSQLLIVEMNSVLHGVLQQGFPEAHVVCGDARRLDRIVAGRPAFTARKIDAVVSSLGLLAMPSSVQRDILHAAFQVLRPGGVFVQYTYGLATPLAKEVRQELGLHCERIGCAWWNLPPARVFVYRRGVDAAADGMNG
jgi:phosphatidylethanolamine/phosphatidyl-N-methylethanolamine N-methyltransferase